MNIFRTFLDHARDQNQAIACGTHFYSAVPLELGHSENYYRSLFEEAKLTEDEAGSVEDVISSNIEEIKQALKRDRDKLSMKSVYMNRWSLFYIVVVTILSVAFINLIVFFIASSLFRLSVPTIVIGNIFISAIIFTYCAINRDFFRKIAERDFMLFYDDYKNRELVLAEYELIHDVTKDRGEKYSFNPVEGKSTDWSLNNSREDTDDIFEDSDDDLK